MIEVSWTDDALQELANLWTKASSQDRQTITDAVSVLDEVLSRRGDTAGESRSRLTERVVVQPPLGVYYVITFIERQMTVVIGHVYSIKRIR